MKTPFALLLGAALLALGACQTATGSGSEEPEALPEIRYFMIADT